MSKLVKLVLSIILSATITTLYLIQKPNPILATNFSFNYTRALNVPSGMHTAGDLDNDGDFDIAVIGGNNFSIFENNGSDNIQQWPLWGNPPHGLDSTQKAGNNGAVLFDVDKDGDLDIVAAKYTSDVGWWENPGGPLSHNPWAFHYLDNTVGGKFLHDLILVDINQDGIIEEFVATLHPGYWDASSTVKWYRPPSNISQNKDQAWPSVTVFANKAGTNNNHAGIDTGDIDGDGDVDISFSNGWVESSSQNGTGPWTWHQVTNIYGVSNNLVKDLDQDGDNDLIMSAGHHGQGVYWFENDGSPTNGGWTFHPISSTVNDIYTRHHFNDPNENHNHIHHPECLQANDLDYDGDLDIVTCALYFGEDPGEPGWDEEIHDLYIFENIGGSLPQWNQQLVQDNNYTNYKLELHDINQDGKLDIIANGAVISNVNLLINTTPLNPNITPPPSPTPNQPPINWWNQQWQYRLPISVSSPYQLQDKPVDVTINFTDLLTSHSNSNPINLDSIRIVEITGQGNIINDQISYQFDQAVDFDPATNAAGNLVFLIPGTTNSTRYFHIYFDTTANNFAPISINPLVSISDIGTYEGEATYQINTQNATYYYHQAGAGFASLVDLQGNDWINYHPGGGSAGEYRGIPNTNHFGHPGNGFQYNGAYAGTTTISYQGPLKITLNSIRHDNAAQLIWEIYPYYIKNTVASMPSDYVWGYEGTPGGTIEPNTDSRTYSNGNQTLLSSRTDTDLPDPEWLYFTDPNVDQVMFLVNHQPDTHEDEYWTMENNMTVFGFGRVNAGDYHLNTYPGYFTFGFAQYGTHQAIETSINNAYRPLQITVSASQDRDQITAPPNTDLDSDDDTDWNDLVILIGNFFTNSLGDFNLTGVVDIFDFNLLIQNL